MSRSPLEKVRVTRSEVLPETEEAPGSVGQRAVTFDALALDAELRQALVAVRSLGSRGLRIAALDTSRGIPTSLLAGASRRSFVPPRREQMHISASLSNGLNTHLQES